MSTTGQSTPAHSFDPSAGSTPGPPPPEGRRTPGGREVEIINEQLRVLRGIAGVTGTLLATVDGRTLISEIDEPTPGSAAAVAASSVALAARLGDLTEPGTPVEELQVRSRAGYACLYVINSQVLLTVVTNHTVNLARLKLEVRSVTDTLRRVFLSTEVA